jgi:lysophospholipase L1-like esterase
MEQVDNGIFFLEAFVDGQNISFFQVSPSTGYVMTVNFLTDDGVHELSFMRRTEANYSTANGILAFKSLLLTGGQLLPVSDGVSDQQTRLLFIGDSLSAAYGVDGVYPCSFTPNTENVLDGYVTLVSSRLNASYHVIAWSGKGVVRNYGDPNQVSADPLPAYYNRTIATDPSTYWDPSNYSPSVVYVMLGNNDYSTQPSPSDEQFITGLTQFLLQIHMDYPSAHVAAACAPHHNGNQCANIQAAAESTGSSYLFIPDDVFVGGYGCDDHPSAQTQVNIADFVTPFITGLLTDEHL